MKSRKLLYQHLTGESETSQQENEHHNYVQSQLGEYSQGWLETETGKWMAAKTNELVSEHVTGNPSAGHDFRWESCWASGCDNEEVPG